MYNKVGPAAAHKAVEMFLKFVVVLFSGDTARSSCTFLAMMNNFILTNINEGRNNAMRIDEKNCTRNYLVSSFGIYIHYHYGNSSCSKEN